MSSCPLYCNFSNDRSLLTLLTYTLTSHRSFFFFFFFKRDCTLFKRSWQTFFYKADFFCEAQRDGDSHCESYLKKDTSKILSKSLRSSRSLVRTPRITAKFIIILLVILGTHEDNCLISFFSITGFYISQKEPWRMAMAMSIYGILCVLILQPPLSTPPPNAHIAFQKSHLPRAGFS